MRVTDPHFRIEFPARFRGQKHAIWPGRVFVTFPELGEVELPRVTDVQLGDGDNGIWEITLTFVASAEVAYVDEERG
jgi:hypothetical protein